MWRRVTIALLASTLLLGCYAAGVAGQVDGWAIGEATPCGPNDARCLRMIEVATTRLDERDLDHPPIVQVSVHAEGVYPDDDGDMARITRSGGSTTVIVFTLADGSRRAIGVKYVLRAEIPTTYDHGPERVPGGGGDDLPASTP
jgi:hypothetical protein